MTGVAPATPAPDVAPGRPARGPTETGWVLAVMCLGVLAGLRWAFRGAAAAEWFGALIALAYIGRDALRPFTLAVTGGTAAAATSLRTC